MQLNRTIFYLIFVLVQQNTISFSRNSRPKIGLVLSGGGAKGIAHIGILKAMEEAGLTPDYITGTSMDSIVGGLYATGYSADELAEILREVDWDLLLTTHAMTLSHGMSASASYISSSLSFSPLI